MTLAEDVVRLLQRRRIGVVDLFAAVQIGTDAPPVVAEAGLDHHGQAQPLGDRPGILGAGHRPPLGHRYAHGPEQQPGQVLVLGDGLGNGAGAVGLRRPDPPLPRPLAKQQQAVATQASHRDVPGPCRLGDGGGARAQMDLLAQLAQPGELAVQVAGFAGQDRRQQGPGALAAGQAHRGFTVLAGRRVVPRGEECLVRQMLTLDPARVWRSRVSLARTSAGPASGARSSRSPAAAAWFVRQALSRCIGAGSWAWSSRIASSRTGHRAQALGPRRARMLRISIMVRSGRVAFCGLGQGRVLCLGPWLEG